MNELKWSLLKSERLKKVRGASFEEVLQGEPIAVKRHPQRIHQNILLVYYRGYIWVIPYVEEESGDFFLKTLFPSRKYTKMYQKGELK